MKTKLYKGSYEVKVRTVDSMNRRETRNHVRSVTKMARETHVPTDAHYLGKMAKVVKGQNTPPFVHNENT